MTDLIDSYNKTKHTTTKHRPIDAFNLIKKAEGFQENQDLIKLNTINRTKSLALKLDFKVNEKVF